ncbi:ricin-type beta-trefoil lectin domain protein [Actinoplanes sp. Pm04-4]|uniref:Ricin-type beta-trefoil lectin domain protein n=1 Tax=Paractinoplanes pyxinae TaxID=2997416 RepID=A0ABT4B5T1_9ACTN|nr:ricin-type beta-trefoil lectin domain protein [Actinoplanes pyxinae]MCY1141235.1 ricin-type beta-trefoil lectin domain protein [Actinoplanes pyxinae]
MPMALLVVTVVVSLSALLVPMVLRQLKSTQNLAERNTALNAAQAGMDVMMARVRAAADQDTQSGYLENLPPCTLNGYAGLKSDTDRLTYTVTLQYRDQDGLDMACPATDVPTTAIVSSVGFGGGTQRTLVATYVFSTSNTNIPGGQIRIASSTLGNQCFDSTTSKAPKADTAILMAPCDGSSRQQFGYTADLYLKLINSESSDAPSGMCLWASDARKAGTAIVFRPCPTVRTTTFQWALDGSSQFHSTTTASKSDGSSCVNVKVPGSSADRAVVLGTCGNNNSTTIWRSATGVGAGMAGDSTNQLVNYAQFSRCLDVTSKSMSATYMIAWFCKQDPGGVVDFNQQWVHPTPVIPNITATGPIIVNNTNATSNSKNGNATNNYCLKSPGIVTATSWVTVVQCATVAVQAQQNLTWTVYHDTGDYGTSYRIKDYKGYCLQPTDQASGVANDFHSDGTSKVKVSVCNTSELQKWNAPANISQPTPLTDLVEK